MEKTRRAWVRRVEKKEYNAIVIKRQTKKNYKANY